VEWVWSIEPATEQLERDVALKVLPSGTLSDDAARRHFRNEALALAKLNHPKIEAVYEFGSQDGTDYLVMEDVPGRTLADKLLGGPLSEKETIALGMQIAAALEEAHERGIVHRDIKPANIAITARGQAKVLDFGLAKLLRADEELTTDYLTDTRADAGTLPYMSPEQLLGEPADVRSDGYTIGVVLYEMAVGRRAFSGNLPSRVVDSILHQPLVPPRALNPRISAELERIILKCLDKDPDQRYQSAKELLVDLRRQAAFSSARGGEPGPAPPFWRKVLTTAALALAALLALGVTFTGLNINGMRDRLTGRVRLPQIRSLAVLPLENHSRDPEQDYFADGVTDELITELAKISALRVISRTSVMRYKNTNRPLPEIGQTLHVDAVVEGSVQRVGDHVKITARLVQASADQELWARSYDQDPRDILTLQSEVARAIANEVQIKLTPQEQAQLYRTRAVNPEAHEAYLAGRFYWNKRTAQGVEKSVVYLKQAIAKDPGYALAYAALADSYHPLPELTLVPVGEAFPRARTAALKALEMDDSLAEAHSALANIKEDYDWDWKGTEAEYKRAIELGPGQVLAHAWYSNLLLELGRFAEALGEAKTAQQLDPLSVFANDNLCAILNYAGEYDHANEQCRKALDIDPMSHQAHRHLAQVYTQRRLYADAVSELKKAIQLSNGGAEASAELGYVFGVLGKKEDARQILRELQDSSRGDVSPYRLAIVYMGLGEKDKALESLRQAVDHRSPGVVHLKISPVFQELQPDQRFQELLAYMGLSGNARGHSD
jgi:eukaryotic-like serine/threonine-protein kinase